MHTSSGLPSPVMSAKVGDSLSVCSKILCRTQWVSLPFGFSNHDVSFPGKPMTRMSFQPSLLKSRAQTKKLSEYLFSLPSVPSKPGTSTSVIGPSFNLNVVFAG